MESSNTIQRPDLSDPAVKARIQAEREARKRAKQQKAEIKLTPDAGKCHLYLPEKKRFCKLEVARGCNYCIVPRDSEAVAKSEAE